MTWNCPTCGVVETKRKLVGEPSPDGNVLEVPTCSICGRTVGNTGRPTNSMHARPTLDARDEDRGLEAARRRILR